MNIAFIANTNKHKKLIANLCFRYRDKLNKHNLYATYTTGRVIEDSTGLRVHKYFTSCLGGEEQIALEAEYNSIDFIVLFREDNFYDDNKIDVNYIHKICNAENIPLAINISTAEILLDSLNETGFYTNLI